MAQPYVGRTVVEILHPAQDLSWRSSGNLAEVVSRIESMVEAIASGTAYPSTVATVSQGGAQATGTVTLSGVGGTSASGSLLMSNVGGTAASGTVTLSGVDGTAATGSVALSNVGGAVATGTVTLGGGAGDVTVTINGEALPAVVFNTTDDQTATDLAAAISLEEDFGGFLCQAAAVGPVVTITASDKGTAGNVTLLASRTAGTATASGANLTGGTQGAVTVVIDGTSIGPTDTTGLSDTAAATAVAAAVELDGTIGSQIAAVGSTSDVNLTWSTKGVIGNAVTLTSNTTGGTGTATASAATLTGGADNTVTVTVDGTAVLTDTTTLSNDAAATAVAAALQADGTFAAKASASAGTNVVTITWDTKGTVGNSKTLVAATTAGTATASGATLASGAQGSVAVTINGTLVTTNTTNITDAAAATAVATAIEANGTLGPLVTVPAPVDENVDITWNAKGLAGNAITFTSTTATGTTSPTGSGFLVLGADGSVTITVNGTAEATNTTNITDEAAATLAAAELNANATINDFITASASGAVVTLEAIPYGVTGNLYTLSSTSATGTATRSAATFAGGTEPTSFTLGRP